MADDTLALTGRQLHILTAVLDTLLPGGDGFPSASAAGTAPFLVDQLGRSVREEWLLPLLAGLEDVAGGDFAAQSAEQRTVLLEQLEAAEPLVFIRLQALAYYSYYAQPAVVAAIQALGYDYNQAPQPLGYAMDPFNPGNPTHRPAVPRGTYKRTLDMARAGQA